LFPNIEKGEIDTNQSAMNIDDSLQQIKQEIRVIFVKDFQYLNKCLGHFFRISNDSSSDYFRNIINNKTSLINFGPRKIFDIVPLVSISESGKKLHTVISMAFSLKVRVRESSVKIQVYCKERVITFEELFVQATKIFRTPWQCTSSGEVKPRYSWSNPFILRKKTQSWSRAS
jgi:hypothetical protein